MKYTVMFAVAALLLVAACGGGSPTGTDDNANLITETAGNIKVETGDDAKGALEAIFSKAKSAQFKVDYQMTNTFGSETQKSQMSLYMKADKFRTDTKTTQDSQTIESRMIKTSETGFVMCTKEENAWQCMKIETPEEETKTPEMEFEENPEEYWDTYGVTTLPPRTIAGTLAACYKLSAQVAVPGFVSEEFCYSKEGVPLYTKVVTEQGIMIQEATSYSTNVPGDAFTPPATPQSFEDMMAQYGAGELPQGFPTE